MSAWRARSSALARRLLALVVVDGVVHVEGRVERVVARAALAGADLAGVRVDDDVRLAGVAEREEADRLLGAVHELVRALLAATERHDLALVEVAPAVGRA